MFIRESLAAATIGAVLLTGSATSDRSDVVPNFGPGRHFLLIDPLGDGRAVEVIGDLAGADRVVVLVPGSDTTLANFDRGLGGVARRAPAVQARNVYEATARSPKVAVIAWLGYDPPEGLGLAALRQDRAEAGARELTRFIGSLPPNATVVLVGHSYGSVVVGLAAPSLGPQVTDIVALGSPGIGAATVSALRTSARVWAATADDDWIRRVPRISIAGFGHGPLPADARGLPTDGVDGHDGYLVPGSSTLDAVADIVLQPAAVASIVDFQRIVPTAPRDRLWEHQPEALWTAVVMLAALSLVSVFATRLALGWQEPRRRGPRAPRRRVRGIRHRVLVRVFDR